MCGKKSISARVRPSTSICLQTLSLTRMISSEASVSAALRAALTPYRLG
jgi:hypothetical protein